MTALSANSASNASIVIPRLPARFFNAPCVSSLTNMLFRFSMYTPSSPTDAESEASRET